VHEENFEPLMSLLALGEFELSPLYAVQGLTSGGFPACRPMLCGGPLVPHLPQEELLGLLVAQSGRSYGDERTSKRCPQASFRESRLLGVKLVAHLIHGEIESGEGLRAERRSRIHVRSEGHPSLTKRVGAVKNVRVGILFRVGSDTVVRHRILRRQMGAALRLCYGGRVKQKTSA
jgi:hypothetical protein